MPPPRLNRRHLMTAAALGTAAFAGRARAASWPERAPRFIVAGAPGGSADIVARLCADALAADLGRTVIVEPKPGAGGVLAVAELSRATQDGHTMLVAVNSLVSEIPHAMKLPLDMAREIVPVAELARGGLVLVGTPSLAPRTLAELIAWAKARPGRLAIASYSAGTLSHVLGVLLNRAAGLDLNHVGYKGSTPALADVMGGHVPLMFDAMPTSLPLLRAGRLKAYAVTLPQRSPLLPDVPTFAELGYPQLGAVAWIGLWSRPGVPPELQARWSAAAHRALERAEVRERLQQLGFEPGLPLDAPALAAALVVDSARVAALLKSIGYLPQ